MKKLALFVCLLLILAVSRSPTIAQSKAPVNILFLLADDWSYPHASAYGDSVIRTPTFDWLGQQGAIFNNAFCAAPSCSPSRAAILTGRYPHQLDAGGNLWSVFPEQYPTYTQVLEAAGYHVGSQNKGWGPGDFDRKGAKHNPAGQEYPSLEAFLADKKEGQAFCYWIGSSDPHREYETNAGVKSGMDPQRATVPAFLPDNACVRNDLLDYYFEVERFDRQCGQALDLLRKKGLLENTLVVMTSDNGMPFPRAKANLYDYGTRMPLVVYWPGHIAAGTQVQEFMNFIDLAPTFLEAVGQQAPTAFSGNSLLPLLTGQPSNVDRSKVYLERERHANVRQGDLSYPVRAVRTSDYLYIRNFEPNRWPAGDPTVHQSVGQFGDVDNSITKLLILDSKGENAAVDYFDLAFGKRPAEELYDVKGDPYNIRNLAGQSEYAPVADSLRQVLTQWMKTTQDRRYADPTTTYWDTVEYVATGLNENVDVPQAIQAYDLLVPEGFSHFEKLKCE